MSSLDHLLEDLQRFGKITDVKKIFKKCADLDSFKFDDHETSRSVVVRESERPTVSSIVPLKVLLC